MSPMPRPARLGRASRMEPCPQMHPLRDTVLTMAPRDAPFPWSTEAFDPGAGEEAGLIWDAGGRLVATVDADRQRPDEEAHAIAALIVLAVNAVAGWPADARAAGLA